MFEKVKLEIAGAEVLSNPVRVSQHAEVTLANLRNTKNLFDLLKSSRPNDRAPLPVRRHGHVGDQRLGNNGVSEQLLAAGHVPDPGGAVAAGRDDALALRAHVRAHVQNVDDALELVLTGILERDVDWTSPGGKRIRVRSRRMVSLTQRAIAAIETEIAFASVVFPTPGISVRRT